VQIGRRLDVRCTRSKPPGIERAEVSRLMNGQSHLFAEGGLIKI
jgi:hypothetical protein